MSMFVIKGLTGSVCDSERERELQYAVYTLYKREHCVLPPCICHIYVCVLYCAYIQLHFLKKCLDTAGVNL